jgi:hypothetical protein
VVLKYELANLRGLRPPGSMATTYKNALADFSAELTLIQGTLPRLDSGGDPVIAIKLLQEQLAPIESRGSLAWQSLGIPACVNQ